MITALRYRSAAKRSGPAFQPSLDEFAVLLPDPADYAAHCLAVGIGQECGGLVATMAGASWFSHLRGTMDGPSRRVLGTRSGSWAALLQPAPPHVASIALPAQPNPAQVATACAIGRRLRGEGTFVMVTVPNVDPALPAALGQACDSVLLGDGGKAHHSYPARTVIEPASGRLICYDLYDVCALWAGRIGTYGVLHPPADALHVELPSEITLQAADDSASELAAQLDQPSNLRLMTVGTVERWQRTNPVSFRADACVAQERVPGEERT